MKRLSFVALFAAAASSLPIAAFAAAPPALYNKTISVSYSESKDLRGVDGDTRHRIVHGQIEIFVSSQGRVFRRAARQAVGMHGSRSKIVNELGRSRGPDGNEIKTANVRYNGELAFNGRSITISTKFESGMRRVTIQFDGGFSSCTAAVTYGKEGGAPGLVHHGMNGRLYAATNISASTPTCSITSGTSFDD
ncbi:MAG TPA: hypothetical protein VFB45_05585 [Pseudolabrys sp.]|nr:hypothetical protein [Pseudolabrys sp.]